MFLLSLVTVRYSPDSADPSKRASLKHKQVSSNWTACEMSLTIGRKQKWECEYNSSVPQSGIRERTCSTGRSGGVAVRGRFPQGYCNPLKEVWSIMIRYHDSNFTHISCHTGSNLIALFVMGMGGGIAWSGSEWRSKDYTRPVRVWTPVIKFPSLSIHTF